MLTGANGSLGAILPYCLEPNGVDLGTVGWLTVIPEHMTAATLGGFRSKESTYVVMKVREEAQGAVWGLREAQRAFCRGRSPVTGGMWARADCAAVAL